MKHLAHRKRFTRKGVSDIIGNLLILAITVTLFSSILYFVTSMPTPEQKVYGDFTASLEYDNETKANHAYPILVIKHTGGQVLRNSSAVIAVQVNNTNTPFFITNSSESIGTTWETGETWRCNVTSLGISSATKVTLEILDKDSNSLVWATVLLDPSSMQNPPIITGMWAAGELDPDTSIWIQTEILAIGQKAKIFVKPYDADGDVRNVSVDVSSITGISGASNLALVDDNRDGVYSSASFTVACSVGAWTVYVFAYDMGNRNTSSSFTVNVRQASNNNNGGGGGGNWSGGGSPPGNLDYSFFQGFSIFKEADWKAETFNATPCTIFAPTEKAVVVVASKFLVNTENENTLLIINPTDKKVVTTVSSPNVVFNRYDYVSGYYVYNCTIDTSKLTLNQRYLVQIQLKDSWVPNNAFFATAMIAYGSGTIYPIYETFSDAGYSHKATSFNSTDTIYVRVTVDHTVDGVWNQYGGDVEIRDYFWRNELKRTPSNDTSNPVSYVTRQAAPYQNVYQYKINLSLANQDPWVPGKNAYMLRYDVFKIDNGATSTQYVLSKVINITAPKIILDLVTGIEGSTSTAWGGNVYIDFYRNDNQWAPADVVESADTKSSITTAYIVRLTDVNGDGKTDIVAALGVGGTTDKPSDVYIYLYLNDGAWTRSQIAHITASPSAPRPTAMEIGNADYDNDPDIFVGFSNGKVTMYKNDGLWTAVPIISTSGAAVTDMKLIDLANTAGVDYFPRSMSVLVGKNTGLTMYKNDGFGMNWAPVAVAPQSGIESGPMLPYAQTNANGYWYNGTWFYEMFREQGTFTDSTSIPTHNIGNDTDEFRFLQENDTILYALDPYKTILVDGWNTPVPSATEPFISVRFIVGYKTDTSYNESAYITWGHQGEAPTRNAVQITPSTAMRYLTFDLTGQVTSTSDLTTLKFQFTNPSTIGYVDFDYWDIVVSSRGPPLSIDHTWLFHVDNGTHQFYLSANTTGLANGDSFEFRYSTSPDFATYNTLFVVNDVISSPYSANLSQLSTGYFGTVYIKVVDMNRTVFDNQADGIMISDIYMKSTVYSGTGEIGSVNRIAVADMNGDHWMDVVVADTSGVWVVLNNHSDFGSKSLVISSSNVMTISVGHFFQKQWNEIMIGTGSTSITGVSILGRTSGGGYASSLTTPTIFTNIRFGLMVADDVNGDGFTDLVVTTPTGSTFNTVQLFMNGGSSPDNWRAVTPVIDSYTRTTSNGAQPVKIWSICLGKVATA